MQNENRDRLIELIMQARSPLISRALAEKEADHLLTNGVIVQDVPDANVGEWEKFHGERFICSCCAKVFGLGSLVTLNDVKRVWKYCPNCGAKMTLEPPKGE